MNSTCPKCGFEQPPDRFCANCGIDMKAYASTIKPSRSFLGVGFFYFILAVFVASASLYFFSKQKNILNLEQLSLLKTQKTAPSQVVSPIVTRSAPTTTSEPKTQAPAESTDSPEQASTLAELADAIAKQQKVGFSEAEQTALNKAKQKIAEDSLTTSAPTSKVVPAKTQKLNIRFAEISHDYVRDFTNQPTRNTPGFILLSDANRWNAYQQWFRQGIQSTYIRILDDPQIHSISLTEQNVIEITKPVGEFRTDNRAGLYIQVILAQQGEFQVLRLNGRRILQTSSDSSIPPEIFPFSEEVDITQNMALAFHAFLPHRRAFETEERYFNVDRIFRVFLSPLFINNTSDLFIIFEYTN